MPSACPLLLLGMTLTVTATLHEQVGGACIMAEFLAEGYKSSEHSA